MQGDHPTSNQSPFETPGLFFPYAGCQSALHKLQNGIDGSTSLITCIGKEGTGKTTLRRILEKEYGTSFLVISFPNSVESFDYALQVIALRLNVEIPASSHTTGAGGVLLLEITQALREQKKRLLILFDEAEKLYLATLERIRKMIDLANEDDIVLQVVLFGRTGLQPHIEQLSLCTFKEIKEQHVILPECTPDETYQYLNFCMQQHPGFSGKSNIFSKEVAAKILVLSQGNFRKINALAWDSLQSSAYRANDPSFMVLLEHVRDDDVSATQRDKKRRAPSFSSLLNKRIVFPSLILVAVAAVYLANSNSKPQPPPPAPAKNQGKQASTDKGKPSPILATPPSTTPLAAEQKAETQPPVPVTSAPPEESPTPSVSPAPPAPAGHSAATATPGTSNPSQFTAATPPITTPVVPEQSAVQPPVKPSLTADAAPSSPPPVAIQEQESTPPPPPAPPQSSVEIAPLVEEKTSVSLVLRADKQAKKNAAIPFLTAQLPEKNKGQSALKANAIPQLPRKSLATGESWLTGKKDNTYTIQLMVLTGNRANEKVSEILTDTEHKSHSDDFVILKKSTNPSSLMLFFGEYPNRAAAKEALAHLPPSLQKYTPYAVSVKQAVEKSKQQ